MKKRTVVLCELCEEDRLAATVVSWGLCHDHVARISQISPSANGASTKRRQPEKKVHKKCGKEVDPRGWSKHVAACRGRKI